MNIELFQELVTSENIDPKKVFSLSAMYLRTGKVFACEALDDALPPLNPFLPVSHERLKRVISKFSNMLDLPAQAME